MLRRAIIVLLTIFVLASLGASWTAVWLLHNASEVRAVQADRAEARAERAEEITVGVQRSIRSGVVCILGQIAGHGDIERPPDEDVEAACRDFLDNGD